MREHRTDNKVAMANATPLFASSWLALFYLLRANYSDRRSPDELHKQAPIIKRGIKQRMKAK